MCTMEFHLNSEKLIDSIRRRPSIWNYRHADYKHYRNKRKELWKAVCEENIQNFDQLPEQEQEFCEIELQKKWRNYRDAFTKEYKKEAKLPPGEKKKPYLYYRQLAFLEPLVKYRIAGGTKKYDISLELENYVGKTEKDELLTSFDSQLFPSDNTNEYFETPTDEYNEEIETLDDDDLLQSFPSIDSTEQTIKKHIKINPVPVTVRRAIARESPYETKIPSQSQYIYRSPTKKVSNTKSLKDEMKTFLKNCNQQILDQNCSLENDPDRMFLLSLMPTFRKLNDDNKLRTQSEILHLLQNRLHDQRMEDD